MARGKFWAGWLWVRAAFICILKHLGCAHRDWNIISRWSFWLVNWSWAHRIQLLPQSTEKGVYDKLCLYDVTNNDVTSCMRTYTCCALVKDSTCNNHFLVLDATSGNLFASLNYSKLMNTENYLLFSWHIKLCLTHKWITGPICIEYMQAEVSMWIKFCSN